MCSIHKQFKKKKKDMKNIHSVYPLKKQTQKSLLFQNSSAVRQKCFGLQGKPGCHPQGFKERQLPGEVWGSIRVSTGKGFLLLPLQGYK